MVMLCGRIIFLAGSFVLLALPAMAASLIRDGGFESPPSPSGYFTTYQPGQKIGSWTVVGASGNVATVNSFNEGGVTWSAHQGSAFVDLTGTCDCGAPSGVSQVVKTAVGTTYKLTFFVGNTYISGQGLTSTVDLYVDSNAVLTATNKYGAGSTKEVWKKFTYTFVASTTTTTISFINGDPSGDEQDGVDAVSLIAE